MILKKFFEPGKLLTGSLVLALLGILLVIGNYFTIERFCQMDIPCQAQRNIVTAFIVSILFMISILLLLRNMKKNTSNGMPTSAKSPFVWPVVKTQERFGICLILTIAYMFFFYLVMFVALFAFTGETVVEQAIIGVFFIIWIAPAGAMLVITIKTVRKYIRYRKE